ncbi:hypothetical protein L1F30_02920 [Simiduia sp. 21SJ11W-1]|uniref:hypothetical protein n=1 Tax=Simiduia sp. 21SJ11W-1 TaxID=2909669 RepID=UPI0020A08760|nr:hypothetical protein [Simiduia sp. 21SJ11W-1]UTA48506.1 hypothetical protein L1F30_02920 [Simiduia sp. 21SJ11W-1]
MTTTPDAKLLHEIRNKLNNISVNTELAKLQTQQGQAQEKVLASLAKVTEACRECATLLDEHR